MCIDIIYTEPNFIKKNFMSGKPSRYYKSKLLQHDGVKDQFKKFQNV